ncbi:MBL fold metallo-hydrolase [Pendulispora rubella]|uniref:MBL fold metallo-hydrolase n=1 Tax=Pendulispora rubella TaxID=2741070 RepID=A0ABZ2L5X7_9BACT
MAMRTILALVAGTLPFLACAAKTADSPNPSHTSDAVRLTYLGVAGWKIQAGDHVLLVDPYFTRVPFQKGGPPLVPNDEQIAKYAPDSAEGILVEHSHWDHLLDVPTVAKRTGATVAGSDSALNVLRSSGVPESQLREARGGETLKIGPFSVRVLHALHSQIGMPSGDIPRGVKLPMSAEGYLPGETLQYLVRVNDRSILFVGSANFIESELQGLRPDVAVVATGAREKIPDYTCRLLRAVGQPPRVLTNHFDAHDKPLDPKGPTLDAETRESLAQFEREVHGCSPSTQVIVPTYFQPLAVERAERSSASN